VCRSGDTFISLPGAEEEREKALLLDFPATPSVELVPLLLANAAPSSVRHAVMGSGDCSSEPETRPAGSHQMRRT
jgi:hypothetical protein